MFSSMTVSLLLCCEADGKLSKHGNGRNKEMVVDEIHLFNILNIAEEQISKMLTLNSVCSFEMWSLAMLLLACMSVLAAECSSTPPPNSGLLLGVPLVVLLDAF